MFSMEELLAMLVAIPSVSGNEASIAGFTAHFCRSLGHETFMIWGKAVDPKTGGLVCDPHTGYPRQNPSVAVLIKGRDRRRCVILNSHLDTVPGDWDGATTLKVRNRSLIGLGVTDTKSSMAVKLELARIWAWSPPPCDVWLFFSREEETTAQGSVDLVMWWAPQYLHQYAKAAVIIMEPTEASCVYDRHRGGGVCHIRISSRECSALYGAWHSSGNLPYDEMNALEVMFRLGEALKGLQKRWIRRYPSKRYGVPVINPVDVEVHSKATNVLPAVVDVVVSVRTNDRLTPEVLVRELATFGSNYSGVVTPSLEEVRDFGVVECSNPQPILEAFRRGWPAIHFGGAFEGSCDMNAFLAAGLPTVICGPGQIGGAHAEGEQMDCGLMERYLAMILPVIAAFASAN